MEREAQAKFQPRRCQESERGMVLRNVVRTKGGGALSRAASLFGPKGRAEVEGPVLNEAYAQVGRQRVSAGVVDSSFCERPTASSEDTVERQDVASSENQAGKRKVHSLIDKV